MFKSDINKISYLFGFSSVSIIILILLYLSLGRATFKYADKVKAEFRAKQAKLQESQELIRGLPNPQKAIEEIGKKVQEFEDMGLSKKQLPRLIQLLGQSANERNINVISIRPREDIKSGTENLPAGVTKFYIEIVLSCTYQVLGDYVKSLTELPVSFTVESISVIKSGGPLSSADSKHSLKNPGQQSELQATLILSTYMVWEL